jgi:glucoamylase
MIKPYLKVNLLLITLAFCVSGHLAPSAAQTIAPGTQGGDAQWATAGKQAVGTSAGQDSKVWFTLAQGVMTEVYYPDVTVANVHLLQFVIVDPATKKVETERDDAIHQIKVLRPDSLTFQQINTAKSGQWTITKTYATDVKRDSILIDVKFDSKNQDLSLYVYFDPSVGNSGMHDSGYSDDTFLFVEDGDIAVALQFSSKIEEATNGFYQLSDGLEHLRESGKILKTFRKAEKGNVVQLAKIKSPKQFTTVVSLAKDFKKSFLKMGGEKIALIEATLSLKKGFAKAQAEYEKGWSDYVKTLPKVEPKYQAQFNMAAMILKAFEDKANRGANIASLSIPWGGAANANEVGSSGYHAVWARDLYQVATAFIALGDGPAAQRALDFLFKIQQKPDGSFPQNSWIDGRPIGGSLQMDQVGFPLILAHELGRFDPETYRKHIKPAADFIVKEGPKTPQERWEEKGGYSPSTIAAEIAGLVCAAEIAKRNDDHASAERWLKIADEWAANVEKWTVTKTGKHSKSPYYVRLTQNGKPDAGEKYEINGVYGMVDERDIVDAGFLELVRLGIKSPNDPIIQNSIEVVDRVIRVNTPNGEGFYRYNLDSYGEPDSGQRWNFDGKWTGKGRLWALLSGERGQYELALEATVPNPKSRLDTMLGFANEGMMIPEQVWDSPKIPQKIDRQFIPDLKFGEGTGSATPLAWSMAQFIRLAINLKAGRNLDTPQVVYDRYVRKRLAATSEQHGPNDSSGATASSVNIDSINYLPILNSQRSLLWQVQSPRVMECANAAVCNDPTTQMRACFDYKIEFKTIEIAGDFTAWRPRILDLKQADPESACLAFSRQARVEYKLIVDGKWINDPLNPNKVDNGVGGENSVVTMPDYKPTRWDDDSVEAIIKDVDQIEIDSKKFGRRRVKVYLPAEYYKRGNPPKMPVLYLQDGSDYISRGKALYILENLIKSKKVEPFVIVFVDPLDRMKEYWANDEWADFMAHEVVPAVEKKYSFAIMTGRENRALLGASLGGITAVHVGLKYPQIFSRIGSQSSSFWIDNERVVKELEKLDPAAKFKFYFDDGVLEGVEDSRKVVKLLQAKGFDVTYVEEQAGHNWTAWRDRLADALIALWK